MTKENDSTIPDQGLPLVVPYRLRDSEPALRERSRLVVAMVILVMAMLVLLLMNLGATMIHLRGIMRLAGIVGQIVLTIVFFILLVIIVRLRRR